MHPTTLLTLLVSSGYLNHVSASDFRARPQNTLDEFSDDSSSPSSSPKAPSSLGKRSHDEAIITPNTSANIDKISVAAGMMAFPDELGADDVIVAGKISRIEEAEVAESSSSSSANAYIPSAPAYFPSPFALKPGIPSYSPGIPSYAANIPAYSPTSSFSYTYFGASTFSSYVPSAPAYVPSEPMFTPTTYASVLKSNPPAAAPATRPSAPVNETERERSFWGHLFQREFAQAKAMIRSGFRVKASDYAFGKLRTIMTDTKTTSTTIEELFNMIPKLFIERFENGNKIFLVAREENIRKLLAAFPNDASLLVAYLKAAGRRPELVIDEAFLESFRSNSTILKEMLKICPSLFIGSYDSLPAPFKRILPGVLITLIYNNAEQIDELLLEYFKIAASNESVNLFKAFFLYAKRPAIVKIIEFIEGNTVRPEIIKEFFSTADLHFVMSNGKTPLNRAIDLRRWDIVGALADNHGVIDMFITQKNSSKNPLKLAIEAETPEGLNIYTLTLQKIRAENLYPNTRKLLSAFSKQCRSRTDRYIEDSFNFIIDHIYGDKVLKLLLVEELVNMKRQNCRYYSLEDALLRA